MPVYNGEKYIREAIDSILAQTYTDFEFLIIDDGSTDRTIEIVSSYNDQRIRLVRNEVNSRIVKTLNKGILLAEGEHIARIDSDDFAYPERLAAQVKYLSENPSVSVVASAMELFDENGILLGRLDAPVMTNEQLTSALSIHNYISHPSVMVRAQVMKQYLYSNTFYEDYELWLRMTNDGHIIHKINTPLGKYRIHSGSIMGDDKKRGGNFKRLAITKFYYLKSISKASLLKPMNIKVFFSMVNVYLLFLYKNYIKTTK
jgi:glycosyltransferase involved in cell wall biosynthesis